MKEYVLSYRKKIFVNDAKLRYNYSKNLLSLIDIFLS